jgi:hypothetical protein
MLCANFVKMRATGRTAAGRNGAHHTPSNRTLTQVRGIRLGHGAALRANIFLQTCLGQSTWESLRFNPVGTCFRSLSDM